MKKQMLSHDVSETTPEDSAAMKGRSLWEFALLRFKNNRAAMLSLWILCLVGLFVLLGPMISGLDPAYVDFAAESLPPTCKNRHWFGTDALGRDLFVRVALGGRLSLAVGLAGAFIAILLGTLYGAAAGYLGGIFDSLMMRLLEILNAFPFMFFVILLVTLFGKNLMLIFFAIGMVSWLDIARIVRGQTLSLKQKEFVEAAIVSGSKTFRILIRHILPNVLGIVVVYASLLVPSMILCESFLSFLGLGVQEPQTSWGALLEEGAKLIEINPWQLCFPAFFLITTLFCLNFIGDGLRDALDPKDR